MEQNLVSIIVPVYKAETYLQKCLNSLINQTYENIEIICVNDGSPDGSLRILKDFQKKDSRIHIINKSNGGVSAARNEALVLARGEYVLFVDADDWIDHETVQIALETQRQLNVDVIMWPYISEHNEYKIPKCVFSGDIVFNSNDVKKRIHRRLIGLLGEELRHPELADSLCPVWGKLYKSELLKGIKFIDLDEIGTYEDGLFNLDVFGKVKSVAYIKKPMYHYRRTTDNSQTSIFRPRLFNQWQELFSRMEQYIDNNTLTSDYRIALSNRIALSIIGLGFNICGSEFSFWEKRDYLKKILSTRNYREAYQKLEMKWFPLHWKLFFKCCKNENVTMLLILFYTIKIIKLS